MLRITFAIASFFAGLSASVAAASTVPAETASPESCPSGHQVLFVFYAGASTVTFDPADPGGVVVAVTDADRQSAVFGDRPDRRANAIETQRVIDFLAGAATDDPANLAIVGRLEGGGKETLVVEVLGASSQPDAGEVILEGRVLEVLGPGPDGAAVKVASEQLNGRRRYESIDVFVDDVGTCCPGDIGCTQSFCPD